MVHESAQKADQFTRLRASHISTECPVVAPVHLLAGGRNALHHRRNTMLKHLLVGAVGLSSLALADSRRHEAVPVPPPPRPAVVMPAVVVPPPPVMAVAPMRDDRRQNRDDRFDVRTANMLLREFDFAVASRDERSLRRIDARFADFISQELAELRVGRRGRFDRDDRRTVEQLVSLQRHLDRLQGRVDRFALIQKRNLFSQAASIAEQDLRDNRGREFDREDRRHR